MLLVQILIKITCKRDVAFFQLGFPSTHIQYRLNTNFKSINLKLTDTVVAYRHHTVLLRVVAVLQ